MLPGGISARFDTSSWPVPRIFTEIQEDGGVSRDEMYRVFNMGLGMVLVCDRDRAREVFSALPDAFEVGETAPTQGRAVLFYNQAGMDGVAADFVGSLLQLAESRIELVPEPVAKEIQGHYRKQNGKAGHS